MSNVPKRGRPPKAEEILEDTDELVTEDSNQDSEVVTLSDEVLAQESVPQTENSVELETDPGSIEPEEDGLKLVDSEATVRVEVLTPMFYVNKRFHGVGEVIKLKGNLANKYQARGFVKCL